MIYNYQQLQNLNYENTKTSLTRYFHKFTYHRKEIKKLKTHEKDFLFENMSLLRTEKNEKAFDLALIVEASEYNFNKLILTYFDNLDFNKPTQNYLGQFIDNHTMKKDKVLFNSYYEQWLKQLETKRGKYLNIVHTELNKRLKELYFELKNGKINETKYNYQLKYINSVGFFIYYKVKLFFDSLIEKFVLVNISGEKIVINIYSFVHILFRHYFPSLDCGTVKRTLNDPLPFLDITNLPNSLRDLLIKYFNYDKTTLTPSREYLLFSFKNDKYIVWLKYDSLEELGGGNGFELRTLYKCTEIRDLDKFQGKTKQTVNSDLSFYF